MEDILRHLEGEAGVKGSLLLSPDGVVVASRMAGGREEERVAALFSFLVRKATTHFRDNRLGTFEHFVMNSTFGKVIVVNAGVGYLVVVTDPLVNLRATLVEVLSAAYRIRKRGQIIV